MPEEAEAEQGKEVLLLALVALVAVEMAELAMAMDLTALPTLEAAVVVQGAELKLAVLAVLAS